MQRLYNNRVASFGNINAEYENHTFRVPIDVPLLSPTTTTTVVPPTPPADVLVVTSGGSEWHHPDYQWRIHVEGKDGERGNRFHWESYRYYKTKPDESEYSGGHHSTERDGSSDWETFTLQERPAEISAKSAGIKN